MIALLAASLALAQDRKAVRCNSITLTAELSARQSFERPLGNELVFRVSPARLGPTGQLDGWEIFIVRPEAPEQDYIYPVNIPLRFNGVQIMGASYNDDANVSLGRPHEMWFLLDHAGYERLWPAVEHALWPYSAPHPDRVADEFFQALKAAETGWLRFTVLSSEVDPKSGSVLQMKFHAEFTVPPKFRFAPGLKPTAASCPPHPQ